MRYIINFDTEKTEHLVYDVVIVGSGVAGLFAALNLSPDRKVCVISKSVLSDTNTNLAQGGVACALTEDDSPHLHYADTIRGGSSINIPKVVKTFTEEAPDLIRRAVELGVRFDRERDGSFHITHEGGHSRRRVLHAGDTTGESIERGLLEAARNTDNIHMEESILAADILTDGNRCCGVLAVDNDRIRTFWAKAIVLATGGAACLYKNTTNTPIATGDGIALAHRAGCEIRNMEFMQFHPTALFSETIRRKFGRLFLVSETVRGEGGILRNARGEAFMERYHEMKDLAPRDVVAAAIYNEIRQDKTDHVYLDITHRSLEYLERRFPLIFGVCLEIGIDMSKDYIPVAPAAHYTVGGIEVDLNSRTTMKNLFACGECANTGVHGANRLAGNSLSEGMVFGARTARRIEEAVDTTDIRKIRVSSSENHPGNADWKGIKNRIQDLMTEKAGIRRYGDKLREALEELEDLEGQILHVETLDPNCLEIKNLVRCGKLLVEGALCRKESCGSHQRFDINPKRVCVPGV